MHIIGLICTIILIILLIYHWAQTLIFILCCGAAIALSIWLHKKGKERNLTPKNNWVNAGSAGSAFLLLSTVVVSFVTKKMWHSKEVATVKYEGEYLFNNYYSKNFSLWKIDDTIPFVIISFCLFALGILLLYFKGKYCNPKKNAKPNTFNAKSYLLLSLAFYSSLISIPLICMASLFTGSADSSFSESGGGLNFVYINSFGLGADGVLVVLLLVANLLFMAVNAYMFWQLDIPPVEPAKDIQSDCVEETKS